MSSQNKSSTRRSVEKTTPLQKEFNRLKRTKSQPPIHPIFLEVMEFAGNDEFWKTKLLYASRNQFPKNFFFRNNTLCYRDQKKDVSRYLGDSPEMIYKNFTEFIRKHAYISSDMDLERMDTIAKLTDQNKKAARSVAEKELYEFLFFCQKEWELTDAQSRSFKECMFFIVRLNGKKSILYNDDGDIIGIKGIQEDPITGLYVLSKDLLSKFGAIQHQKENTEDAPLERSHFRCKEEDFETIVETLRKSRKNITYEEVLGKYQP